MALLPNILTSFGNLFSLSLPGLFGQLETNLPWKTPPFRPMRPLIKPSPSPPIFTNPSQPPNLHLTALASTFAGIPLPQVTSN